MSPAIIHIPSTPIVFKVTSSVHTVLYKSREHVSPFCQRFSTLQFVMARPLCCICLLLLLMLSQTSAWTLFGPEACSGQTYNALQQICCAGQLLDRPSGTQDVSCCGAMIYDAKTRDCCRNLLRGVDRVVVRQPGKSHMELCVEVWKTEPKTE
ncbi:hypothetical protein LSAT2_032584 [Lamellibrachia satsuma]|nr:hypothetical protein LSAT2_032584 [Lamellibrachia satsuma]